ncbi:MAG: HDOD domain-containing protein [Gammaproteobacteria bacterium]|nr:HDOD domain-containing protein [Gammaproteobacteria bacterium]
MNACTNELKELPPLSSSAREILKIINNDDADISHFSQVVERDPALLSRIIGLANSAFYGTRTVTDARRAIIDVLGFRTAKNIVLGIVLGGIFNPRLCKSFDLSKYWFVSLMTATFAREITVGLKMSASDASNAYLSGMLNEIGLMALAYLYPVEMAKIFEDDIPVYEGENHVFGQDHYEISAGFLHDWQLPDIIINVMLESSQNTTRDCGQLCHIVSIAHRMADKIYENEAIDLNELSLPDIIADQPQIIDSIIEKASGQVETYRELADLLS